MKVVIVGAPGAEKWNLVKGIAEQISTHDLTPVVEHELNDRKSTSPELGFLADYREEMWLALKRVFAHLYIDNSIMTHSLVDSLAYSGLKLVNASETLGLDDQERAAGVFVMTKYFAVDSFKADFVFYVPGNNGEPFNVALEEALEATLIDLDIDYLRLEGDLLQDVDTCVTLIREKYDADTRGDTEERQSK